MPSDHANSVLTDLARLQFSKFLNVAALAVFVYDYCLTFSSEVEHVWGTKWETTHVVFTMSRYLPFVSSTLTCYETLIDEGCGRFILALDAIYTASIIFAEGILILRTYALWGRSKRILFLLLFLAAAFIASAEVTALLVDYFLPADSSSIYKSYPSACPYGSSRNAAFQYALLMLYEIILQSMNSWRKFVTYRNVQCKTLNTLYWDGIMYMWWIIALSAANMTVMIAAPIAYIPALDTAQVAIHSVLASRIFFNLRECDRQTQSFTNEEHSLSTMHYRTQSRIDAATQTDIQPGVLITA